MGEEVQASGAGGTECVQKGVLKMDEEDMRVRRQRLKFCRHPREMQAEYRTPENSQPAQLIAVGKR